MKAEEVVTMSKVLVLDKRMSAIAEVFLRLLGDEEPGRREQQAWVKEEERARMFLATSHDKKDLQHHHANSLLRQYQ